MWRGLTFRQMTVGLLFGAVAVFACLMPAQGDTFWHLRAGQEIWRTLRVPLDEHYSYTAVGGYWPNHEWLWQAFAYGLYRAGGMPLLLLGSAAIIVGACAILYRLCVGSAASRLVLFALSLPLATRAWALRPQLVSTLALAILLWLLVHERHRLAAIALCRLGERARRGRDGDRGARRGGRRGRSAGPSRRRARSPARPGAADADASLRAGDAADAARLRSVALRRHLDGALSRKRDPGVAADLARRSLRDHLLGAGAGVPGVAVLAPGPAAANVLGGPRPLDGLAGHVGAGGARHPQHLCVSADRHSRRQPAAGRRFSLPKERRRSEAEAPDHPRVNLALLVGISALEAAGVLFAWHVSFEGLGWQPISAGALAAVRACPEKVFGRYNDGGPLLWFVPERRVFSDTRQDPYPLAITRETSIDRAWRPLPGGLCPLRRSLRDPAGQVAGHRATEGGRLAASLQRRGLDGAGCALTALAGAVIFATPPARRTLARPASIRSR